MRWVSIVGGIHASGAEPGRAANADSLTSLVATLSGPPADEQPKRCHVCIDAALLQNGQ